MDDMDDLSDLPPEIRSLVEKIGRLPLAHQAAFESVISRYLDSVLEGSHGDIDVEEARREVEALAALFKSIDDGE